MPRRPLDFQSLDQLTAELVRLRDSGYTQAGNWTLGQISDHLAIFFRGSLDGFSQRVPWLIRITVGKLILRSIFKNRGMREGVKVPQSFLPGDPRDDARSVDELLALIDRFRDHPGDYHPSPLFGHLTRQQWTELHLIHAAHHLSFLTPEGAETPQA
jgi:hypothetical protein